MVRLFVEGVTDVKFLEDYIYYKFNRRIIQENDIIKTGGYGSLYSESSINQLRYTQNQGGINLVIFDADLDFVNRKNELTKKSIDYQIDLELFLYPNNQESGDRESLLQSIANPEKYGSFATCFDPYATCIEAYKAEYDLLNAPKLTPFQQNSRKTAIHNYLIMHGQEAREKSRNYADTAYWNLDSDALNPLYSFLAPHFSKPI
ncbi:DUF3226 domain-containing protein [Fibrella aquatilis]|uniref:Uncharacterized protein n=1 Tax=Fibrella aquatilis TaxID=2817059 RepID=A0A939JVK9_9BACT|nr:DUF3226 domain-containing protein [Fibrella aquatilis]MBO0930967.1 hypothetical protein [Fibrella aquatilis]